MFFQELIQKLTFRGFTLYFLYESSGLFGKDRAIYFDENDKVNYEHNVMRRTACYRYTSILSKLCVDETKITKNEILVKQTKKYTSLMEEQKIQLYNMMSELCGYPSINHILSNAFIKEAINIDNDSVDNKKLEELYPYYVDDKEKSIGFIEYVLLTGIYFTTRKKSLEKINKPIKTLKDREWVESWKKKVINEINSKKMLKFYTAKIFDFLYCMLCDKLEEYDEKYSREFLLSKQYKKAKNYKKALKKYKKWQECDKDATYSEMMERVKINNTYDFVEYLGGDVIWIIDRMIYEEPIFNAAQDSFKYKLAKEYYDIIYIYVKNSIANVELLLEKIFE